MTPDNTLIKYYSAGSLSLGLNTTSDASGSGISYLANDSLGSVSEALNQTGTANVLDHYSATIIRGSSDIVQARNAEIYTRMKLKWN